MLPENLMRGLTGLRRYILVAGIFSFAINALTLCIPLYTIQVYDRVLYSGSGSTLILLSVAAIAALVAAAALDGIRAWLLIALGAHFDAKLAPEVFQKAATGNPDFSRPGIMRDLDTFRGMLTGAGIIALFDLPWTPLFVLACWILHPVLAIVTLVGLVLVALLAAANQIFVSSALTRSNEEADASYKIAESVFQKSETVNSMGMFGGLAQRWHVRHDRAVTQQAKASARNAVISSMMKFVRFGIQVAIMAAGAWLAVQREISPGVLFAASLLCTRAILPVDQIVSVWRQIASGLDAMKRVDKVLQTPLRTSHITLPTPHGRLVAENLTYMPPNARAPAVSAVSFVVEPGEAIGIVGPSGGGKSTLARLILGVAAPTKGTIRLDGAETHTWERSNFGQHVGYLPQNVELFEGTIAENIARFRKCESGDIIDAARLAGVHDMILALPNGYDTALMPSGAPLSGGQRQRIALARAVIGQPKLVVLDEPNSNLDGEGEAALVKLITAMKERSATVLMIAHRPSVLACLDKIMVLTNGVINEFNTIDRVMPRIAPGYPLRRAGARA